jgi:hypothetical protein
MAGLGQNIEVLTNAPHMTFLKRATKLNLGTLQTISVFQAYETIFDKYKIEYDETALMRAATLTRGFPYLFQLLGNGLWGKKEDGLNSFVMQQTLNETKEPLFANSYDIIYQTIPNRERKFLFGMLDEKMDIELNQIVKNSKLTQGSANNARTKLLEAGIIERVQKGVFRFTLPFFDEYLSFKKQEMEIL